MKVLTKIQIICLFLAILFASYVSAQTTIQFAGIQWTVRSGSGGPGPNYWSNSSNSVWVDSQGQLHMKIRKSGNTWYCSEIYAQQSFGYGEYKFYVSSNVENYDPNIVAGLFLYENDSREIDIEFSRWGNQSNVDGWYTVQPPPYTSSNQNSFSLNLTGDYSTHRFVWSNSNIYFQSYHGHYSTLPSTDFLINQWTYTGNNNPPVGNERLHINFWLYNGQPPTNQNEAELIIGAVYVPSGSLNVSLSPSSAVSAGAQWNLDGNSWQNSGVTLNNISLGSHTVNFKDISGWNTPSNKTITIYNNQITNTSATYTQQTGSLKVTLFPSDAVSAGAQWNLDGNSWQNSGVTLNNISLGSHTVNFKDISGWNTPSNKTVTIYNNQTTNTSATYTQQTGSLKVTLSPSDAVSAGAQWNLDGNSWQNSGVTLNNISLGSHTVNFKDISGWNTPSNKTVTIYNNQTSNETGNYIIIKPSVPTLVYPSEYSVGIPKDTVFYWRAANYAISYGLQISTDSAFTESKIAFDTVGIIDTMQNVTALEYNTHYYWRVNSTNSGGTSEYSNIQGFTTAAPTAIEKLNGTKPSEFYLFQNYPNPFNPSTKIKFSIPIMSFVTLSIYDALGRKVKNVYSRELGIGTYIVTFNANNLPSGIYFYRINVLSNISKESFVKIGKMLLLK